MQKLAITPHKNKQQYGIALVSVLFISAAILILVSTVSFATLSQRENTQVKEEFSKAGQTAEAVSERARLKIVETLDNSPLTTANFLSALRQNKAIKLNNGKSVRLTNKRWGVTINGVKGKWEIRDISDGANGWVEIAATATSNDGVQTVIRRISFGESSIFNLAMLTETVNCIFCHLTVNGDVGALKHFRPGWGHEGGSGKGSGAAMSGSLINGNVYAARTISNDRSDLDLKNRWVQGQNVMSREINGAKVTGEVEVESKSQRLPDDVDGDGIADFPPINRQTAKDNSIGKLSVTGSGTLMVKVPTNNAGTSQIRSVPNKSNSTVINENYDGSVILVGTKQNPINISDDIYVSGDVIIKGYITGRGAVYAGRNIYFADDVITVNPPDKVGEGICSGLQSNEEGRVACAKLNIADGRDEFRAGARNNIIIGNYTEYDKNGNLINWNERNSADFYRAQFGFSGGNRYYEKGTGDELEQDCSSGSCVYTNVDKDVVSASNVQKVAAKRGWKNDSGYTAENQYEAYDYSFKPGSVDGTGKFNSWLSDGAYQELLGREELSLATWRWSGNQDKWKIDEQVRSFFQPYFEKQTQEKRQAAGCHRMSGWARTRCEDNNTVKMSESSLSAVQKYKGTKKIYDNTGKHIGNINWSGSIKGSSLVEVGVDKQVERIDAYLYANQRIAGKTFAKGMAINGGMSAKEIGMLVPGRKNVWSVGNNATAKTCNNPNDKYYVENTSDCGLTINYDDRLKNGGYGYTQVKGVFGKTISWYYSDDYSERVK